ncbi:MULTISPECIES: hypothetical protein [Ralstonia]|jgi:hypothetical protein|uniref:Uncharacterized protein n=2 Tax=Ralstonia pickettii TaxID=329 RepID=R0DX85_RALPI|nr:hypothetical protein [Ralstonia pickettii]ENZ78038.1 hypothetical protein OR214_02314 [Ralstonia pickettii OR214]MCM3581875.1 hypothetical protein [Ralstonia pickettii]
MNKFACTASDVSLDAARRAMQKLSRMRRHGSRKVKVAVRKLGSLPPTEAVLEIRAAMRTFDGNQGGCRISGIALTLKDGKFYKNSLGEVEKVKLVDESSSFPFEGVQSLMRFTREGRYVEEPGSACSAFNLVAEA